MKKEADSMEIKLNVGHKLYDLLLDPQLEWWENLKYDKDLYVDVRKDNYINIYCNGGSIMKLEGSKALRAAINSEYIPLDTKSSYVAYQISDGAIGFGELGILPLENFSQGSLEKIKKRVRKFYPNKSEKGIQGKFVTHNNRLEKSDGFFIDTEFQHGNKRIDLVWVDLKKKKIFFVELKTIGDSRLYLAESGGKKKAAATVAPDEGEGAAVEMIDEQLRKYAEFAQDYAGPLLDYYGKIFAIKKKLGLLPAFVAEESLAGYTVEARPILLVGDCTRPWIDQNAENLNRQLGEFAYGCFYHGVTTNSFRIPEKTDGNKFVLASAEGLPA